MYPLLKYNMGSPPDGRIFFFIFGHNNYSANLTLMSLPDSPTFLYARLKNGRTMLYPSASVRPSVRPSVCKLFRFRVTPPTVYVRLS